MKLEKIRSNILKEAKPFIQKNGWNESLFLNISQNSNFKIEKIQALFPEGYKGILQIYLDEINNKMTDHSQKIKLIQLRVHERIRELIILRLKIMLTEKKIISKTFLFLLLPNNYKLSYKNLYKTVDQMWYLSGDTSTDFNFYTKRAILSSIYSNTLVHFTNNDNFEDTISFLDKQLKVVSKIPKIKNRFKDIKNIISYIPNINKKFNFFKQ